LNASLLLALLLAASPAPAAPPSVLLITVDTLRPDALGWVAGKNDTPELDRLAREGVRFRAAVSPVPLTLPSHASLMTGLLPRHHGVRDNGQVLGAKVPVLAQRLRERGYATGAFVSGFPLRAIFGLDRGFGRYDDTLPVGAEGWTERPATETAGAALLWLKTAPRPFFLWIHFYDPHDPYTPSRAFWRPGPRGAYDGEVATVDAAIGTLREGLGAEPGLLTVMTGDHGESLGEHGEGTHGFFVYDSTALVPLVFHWPGHLAPAEPAGSPRLIDVAPTLVDLLGLPRLPDTDGASLKRLLQGQPQAVGAAYLETLQPWISYGWAPLKAIRQDGFKLIVAPRPELYDLAADPGETKDARAGRGERAFQLERELARVEARPEAGSQVSDDPEVAERLRALGYVGGTKQAPTPGAGLADPKDRVALRDRLAGAEAALRRGDLPGALAGFEQVLREEPQNRFATLRSGITLLRKGDFPRAAERLRRALAQDPTQAETHYALADALTRMGDPAAAVPEWMETVRLQPRRAAAWSNLGVALLQTGKPLQALDAFREAARLQPGDRQLLGNLGFAQRRAGLAEALRTLEEASRLGEPASFAYPSSLGLELARTGRAADALAWLQRGRAEEEDYAAAQLELAGMHAAAGRPEPARAALDRALARDPKLRDRAASDPRLSRLLPGS
jgi:arylsulfatase A-like enzyme/tetratricopeptide (TPR) repeat protein